MKPKIWIERALHHKAIARLKTVADVIADGDDTNLTGADVVVVSSAIEADGRFMDFVGPRLKVIARPDVGVDNISIEAATERGILVIHTPDTTAESTAEHTIALLLAVAKRVVTGDRQLRGAKLERTLLLGTEVRGRILGVIGSGIVASRVSEICALGLGMQVMMYDQNPVDADWAAKTEVTIAESLPALLAASDFVTLHTALTPETHRLLGEAELKQMKPGAYLINSSRGALVDETSLIQLLKEGHLAGAGLDVFDPEPPLPNNPLLRMPNVVVTPHSAAYTDNSMEMTGLNVADQILQIFRREQPGFLVNPEVWPGRLGTRD